MALTINNNLEVNSGVEAHRISTNNLVSKSINESFIGDLDTLSGNNAAFWRVNTVGVKSVEVSTVFTNTRNFNLSGNEIDDSNTGYVDQIQLLRGGVASASTKVTNRNQIIGVDTSSQTTLTLASTIVETSGLTGDQNTWLDIKDEAGNANSGAQIDIQTEGSITIDGTSQVTISSNYGSVRLYSDRNNFFTL